MLANGAPIHVVQARLGHKSIQTTIDTYGHLLPDAQILAAAAASLAFRGGASAGAAPQVEGLPDGALRELASAVAREATRRDVDLSLQTSADSTAA